MIIRKYQQLKQARDQDPYHYPMFKEALERHAHKMSERPRLMRYIEERFPTMAKNIKTLSRAHQREKNLDIDR